MADACNTSNKL